MAPKGLAIIIGAGPNTGTGIIRILSKKYAVAMCARNKESLSKIQSTLKESSPESVMEIFPTSTDPDSLKSAFQDIRTHQSFKDLKLKLAVYSIKHSSKKPFMEETYKEFTTSLTEYVGGAFAFAQESAKLMFEHHGTAPLSETREKKGTIIFTGTLGAMRSNAEYAAYGAGRAGVRQLAQSLGKEMSPKGIHVVHTIANGGIEDADGDAQATGTKMSADSVGKTYLWLSEQEQDLWTSELDMRPAAEKY
ncbi:NAD(P)-binding Rossmann-fold containing protein [Glarea lozoyensis ATCC 20868]|uniref:NAD(P)-binding Rossmann-fold containing protein n=1 Tax=Glarea lozoyensis (strain ATCC 20868 / MF5171) TaxID=1116229 RepID=S3CUS2_GLAL2|nr:NAD(P)-binding Rossmann-fold containing protein [Glarea lozoyensis ATCC 20868]EPE30152.1 NAD(P)-binding Rossmann-fold containing protein [Glarea lozoyensis ATCC 20868]